MLTKRTNVLLSDSDYAMLSALSSSRGETMGELIRVAVRKVYQDKKVSTRSQVLRDIDRLAKNINTKGIDYRALIEDGRKY